MYEIPYDHDMQKAEWQNEIWYVCAELELQWNEGIQYLSKQQKCYRKYVPFSDLPEEPIPF